MGLLTFIDVLAENLIVETNRSPSIKKYDGLRILLISYQLEKVQNLYVSILTKDVRVI